MQKTPLYTLLGTLGCPLTHPFSELWNGGVYPCGFYPLLQPNWVLMEILRQTGWLCLARKAREAECHAESNDELNNEAQHKKVIMRITG